jgi:hypothetical protein
MAFASVGMLRRAPRALLVGIICHALLGILATCGFVGFAGIGVVSLLGGHEAAAWAPLFLIFAAMWLPFVLLSGWAFVRLRRLRT